MLSNFKCLNCSLSFWLDWLFNNSRTWCWFDRNIFDSINFNWFNIFFRFNWNKEISINFNCSCNWFRSRFSKRLNIDCENRLINFWNRWNRNESAVSNFNCIYFFNIIWFNHWFILNIMCMMNWNKCNSINYYSWISSIQYRCIWFSIDINCYGFCIFFCSSNWLVLEYWCIYFRDNFQWNVCLVSLFDSFYFSFLLWLDWMFDIFSIFNLFNRNIDNIILCDWLDCFVCNWNEMLIINFDYNFWYWFYCWDNWVSKYWFINFWNNIYWNVCLVSEIENIDFSIKWCMNSFWNVVCFSSRFNWNIWYFVNDNRTESFISDWNIMTTIYFNNSVMKSFVVDLYWFINEYWCICFWNNI